MWRPRVCNGAVGEGWVPRCGSRPTSGAPDGQGGGDHRQPEPRPGSRDHDGPGGWRPPRWARPWTTSLPVKQLGHPRGPLRVRLIRVTLGCGGRHGRGQGRGDRPGRRRARSRPTCWRLAVEDIEVEGGNYFVKGSPDRAKSPGRRPPSPRTWASTCRRAWSRSWTRSAYYDVPNCTWPFGTHIAIVEVDEETGLVELVRYVAVDDVGENGPTPMTRSTADRWRHRPGRRAGALGGCRLRRERPAAVGLDARLRPAAGVVAARLRARRDRHALARQPAGRQGRGEGGRHRQHPRRGQRRARRARAPSASAISTCP